VLFSLLLIFTAIAGGALLTYLYAPGMPVAARLCAGAASGLALLATVGFVAASLVGMDRAALVTAAGALCLPALLLFFREYRAQIAADLAGAAQAIRRAAFDPTGAAIGYVILYASLTVLLGVAFAHVVFQASDGLYTGFVNNLGDLPFHLQITSSFAHGQNFPPEDPAFAGTRFTYPFIADFLTAMLVRAGASVVFAMWIQNFVLGISLVGMLHYWTEKLTRSPLAGVIAPVLVLFSGGLGWWMFFTEASAADSGPFEFLRHLPHDYTIAGDSIWRWGNSLTTLFIPQRSILFGVPLALLVFSQWWLAVSSSEADVPFQANTRVRRMMAAGFFAGLLPLVHAHSFIVVMGVGVCLALLFPLWRMWIAFFAPALIIGLPEIFWSTHGSGIHAQMFSGWSLGWDRGHTDAVWFWLANTGAFIPLLIAAILWRQKQDDQEAEDDLVPARLLRFYLPFLACFVVPNLVKLAPWVWDNIKVLFYWYIASVPLVALLLATWFARARWRWLAITALVVLTLAGALDIVRAVTASPGDAVNAAQREFDNDGIAIARAIAADTEPRALVLHAPVYNPPVFLTGRRSLLGYPGQIWSRGLDAGTRETDIQKIYSGAPDALQLMRRAHVDYVLLGPEERQYLSEKRSSVNDEFWQQFPVIAQSGEYRLYKIGASI
jgi:hypothetical protein